MANIITECSKYFMIVLIIMYTYECFTVFGYEDEEDKERIFRNQNILMFMMHFMAFMSMYFQTGEVDILKFYGVQVVILAVTIFLYTKIYPKASRLVVNNMCMLLSVGFIMITRLEFNKAVKQSIIVGVSVVVSLIIPAIIRKLKGLHELRLVYAVIGIVALASVVVIGQVSGGAKLGFEIAGFGIQPSEFVKILFVFFVAASFYRSTEFRDVVITTVVAAFHVLILVISKDLGAALIIFVVYLVMLYVATRQPLYILAGSAAGCLAGVLAYNIFSHVRVRVIVWQDPFASYNEGGYQVAQSLFAIGTGSWFGTGLYQGRADAIPVADEDFIFSAISEEMGLLFALCLILICLSCYIMFLNIAMRLHNQFYKLVALGLGTCYIFQTFLNIGGVTKFIPSTGVTLPLVSYGGSSVLSTLIMFAIIQGLYILREDEEKEIERKKRKQTAGKKRQQTKKEDRKSVGARTGYSDSGRRSTGRKKQGAKTKKEQEIEQQRIR